MRQSDVPLTGTGHRTFARTYFILAPSYHGVTLLARLLHSHPNVVCLGDTYPRNKGDQRCGCGERVDRCSFWADIRQELGAACNPHSPQLLPFQPHLFGDAIDRRIFRHAPVSALDTLLPKKAMRDFSADYARFLAAVYSRCGTHTPAVFVDGVKSAARVKALLLGGTPIDGILHVVRDPVDYVHSTIATRPGADADGLAREWRNAHRNIKKLTRCIPSLRVDYESLCSDTDKTLANVWRFVGLPAMDVEALRASANSPWHFVGNASMLSFDWRIEAKEHASSTAERHRIEAIARPGTV